MAKRKVAERESAGTLGREIFGILYTAIGVLVAISLVSRHAGRPDVLGPIFGTRLSSGLHVLVGQVAAALVPLAIIVLGVRQIRGDDRTVQGLLLWVLAIAETSGLTAVGNIRYITHGAFPFPENKLGNAVMYALHYVFGPHPLGPCFFLVVGLVVSLLLILRIDVRTLMAGVLAGLRAVGTWGRMVVDAFAGLREGTSEGPDGAEEPDEAPMDEEARRLYDEQLAAFRARRNEPPTISSAGPEEAVPAPAAEADDEEEEEEPEPKPAEPVAAKPKAPSKPYRLPSPDVLSDPPAESSVVDEASIRETSAVLEKTLLSFGIEGKVVNVSPGPVINRFEVELAPGIKVSKVVNLQDDISLAVGGLKIRIQAPIPGKSAIGIELPTPQREIVHFKHVLMSEAFRRMKGRMPVVIGKTTSGAHFVTDVHRMPHLLVAGQTGSGKSVCINCLICSLLMTKTPDELRLIIVDPKKVELSAYEGIPHLLAPVVTESKEAVGALQWGVREMDRRYRLLYKVGARDIDSFNAKFAQGALAQAGIDEEDNKLLPYVVILVDELADLMMTASRDVETLVMRIGQLARAVGLHLIVATQRPSVDIITGLIKANLTSRIAFRTTQSTDSRTILGYVGAEKLLGLGDMLFLRNGAPDIERFHGAFISEEDVTRLVASIREQNVEVNKIANFQEAVAEQDASLPGGGGDGQRDELFDEAARVVVQTGQGSTSLLQRRMKIGFARAGRLMDELHAAGIVGPQVGPKMREVQVGPEDIDGFLDRLNGRDEE